MNTLDLGPEAIRKLIVAMQAGSFLITVPKPISREYTFRVNLREGFEQFQGRAFQLPFSLSLRRFNVKPSPPGAAAPDRKKAARALTLDAAAQEVIASEELLGCRSEKTYVDFHVRLEKAIPPGGSSWSLYIDFAINTAVIQPSTK